MVKKAMSQSQVALLKARLALHPAAVSPTGLVPAGVLVPLFFKEDAAHLLFTQRTENVKDHRGQISFPGGVRDAADPHLLATALRETQEEIGLNRNLVQVLGSLPPIATLTGYFINSFVGLIPYPYEFRPNSREVQRLLLLPLAGFYAPERWSTGAYRYQGQTTRVCCWRANHEVIWGATARIVLNLLAVLDQHPVPGDKDATCLD